MGFKNWLLEQKMLSEMGWDKLPKGWTKQSIEKFARSLTGKASDEKGMWTECYEKLKDKPDFGEEGAKKFCSSLVDEIKGKTDWRTGPKGKHKD